MQASPGTTFLFTDIEGSTRLWEKEPDRMRPALARHDALARATVARNHGTVVKMTGDGVHAAFDDPLDAVNATLELQSALADPPAPDGIALRVRCGLHVGVDERRDGDFFGPAVNKAARVMSVAHGGQVLLSEAVAALLADRLPASVALRDLGAVRLRDLARPERVYQVLHPRLRQQFPPLRSLEATPNNLPQQVTSFVGRERELAEARKLLESTRLLTLTGPGGIGKTRLSLQLGADVIEEYPDGVWFVELAPLTDARLVPQAIASVIGVKEEAGRPVAEALLKYVSDHRLLLILDNCEHLVHACAELAHQLLRSAPHMKIVTSSREHLHTTGESVYTVPGLSVPDIHHAVSIEAMPQYEAMRLFTDRAVAARAAFDVTRQNADAITDICRRLDGIPLAIELAAARVRAMSVEEIATRLTDRFRLLARGDRTALPRQQTLRALIDWSHDLLTTQERIVFRRLAVFAGGWTLEAAETVAAGGEVDDTDVLDLLTNLVEKSLVALDAEGGRYRLLETMRQYAQEQLDKSGEVGAVFDRYVSFYLAFAENARPQLVGPQQGAWLSMLDLERENFLAAHTRAAGETSLRLSYAVSTYWLNRGLLSLGHGVMVEALRRGRGRTPARCRALFDAGHLCCFMGRYEEGQEYLEESLAIARETSDKQMVAMVLQPLGLASMGQGKLAAARGHLGEALALAREMGDRRELAAALNAVAQLTRLQGELDAAEPLYENVVSLARELDDRETIAIGLLNLAMVSIGRGAHNRARSMLLEVIAIVEETGSKPVGQSVLEVCTGFAASLEEWERAVRFYGAAELQTGETGLHRDPADEAFLVPLIEKTRKTLGATAFAEGERIGRTLSYEDAMADARAWLHL